MRTVLCYGDSITWGSNPAAGGQRHARADRWPVVLQDALGAEFEVIAEGLRGRSTAFDEHLADCDRNGARLLPSLLYTHAPLDLVILMLGTNDMKPAIAGNAASAMLGMRRCVEIVRQHSPRLPGLPPAKVIIVSPPHVVASNDPFFDDLFTGAITESRKLAAYYAQLATELGCGFFDAARVAQASAIDGVHLDAANSHAIGVALAPIVRNQLKD